MKKRKRAKSIFIRHRKSAAFIICGLIVLAFLWPYLRSFFLKTFISVGRAKFGTLEDGTKGEAVFFRKEVVLRAPASGSIKFSVKDGDVLRVGDVIADISQEGVLEGAKENLELSQKALYQYEKEKSAVISNLSNETDEEYKMSISIIDNMRTAYLQKDAKAFSAYETELRGRVSRLSAKRRDLGVLLDERAAFVRDVEMAQMILASSSMKILSPMAGVYSQKVLELDEKITLDSLSNKNAAELMVLISDLKNQRVLSPIKGSKVSRGDLLGKVVSTADAWFFMPLKTEERPDLKEGGNVVLRFLDGESLEASIQSVTDGNPKGYSVIRGTVNYLPADKKERVANVSLVTNSRYGAVLDARSLIWKDGKPGVLTVEKTYASFQPVEVLMTKDNQVVVKGLKDTDEIVLKPFGFLEGRRVR